MGIGDFIATPEQKAQRAAPAQLAALIDKLKAKGHLTAQEADDVKNKKV
jgi:hypothetical protein